MRAQAVVVFFAGFAAGVVFLAALFLWQMPNGRTLNAAGAAKPAPVPLVARREIGGPRASAPAADTTASAPAADTTASAPAANTTATPSSPAPGLLIPVEGVKASDLRDDFQELRFGHRHEAIDIPAPRGTPVIATAEGNVIKLFHSKPGGLTVYQFDDGQTWCYYYAHLDHYVTGLAEGTLLRRGDVLGYVGTSGDAAPTAPHLHFAIFKLGPEKRWWEGTAVDPYPFLSGHGNWFP